MNKKFMEIDALIGADDIFPIVFFKILILVYLYFYKIKNTKCLF
jgi:hypothetical protein